MAEHILVRLHAGGGNVFSAHRYSDGQRPEYLPISSANSTLLRWIYISRLRLAGRTPLRRMYIPGSNLRDGYSNHQGQQPRFIGEFSEGFQAHPHYFGHGFPFVHHEVGPSHQNDIPPSSTGSSSSRKSTSTARLRFPPTRSP